MKPSFIWFVKDTEKCYSYCDLEKDTDNSEEKELEKNEFDFFDKIIFTDKIYFISLINEDSVSLFHFLNNHNSQFKEIFSPPPEIV